MAAVSLILTIFAIIVTVTKVVIVDAEASVGAAVMCLIGTDELALSLILSPEAVDFAVTSPTVSDALFTALEAGIVT
jgi:hypothetical protein